MHYYLFPRFLTDPAEYAHAEAFWQRLWDELTSQTGQQHQWHRPWLQTAYADGTPFRDGDPIFSAWSPARRLGVRVIQNDPRPPGPELTYWTDKVGDAGSGGEVRTLVISCVLSRETAGAARVLMLSWMRYGAVTEYPGLAGQSWGAGQVTTLNTNTSGSASIEFFTPNRAREPQHA